MEKRKTSNRFSPEVRERAVRMVLEHGKEHTSQWEAIGSIAAKIGCTAETLRGWVRQADRDHRSRLRGHAGRFWPLLRVAAQHCRHAELSAAEAGRAIDRD